MPKSRTPIAGTIGKVEDLALSELQDRLQWFVNLRWIAAGAVAVAALVLWGPLAITAPVVPLVSIAAAIALYNLLFWLLAKRLSARRDMSGTVLTANAQISVDLVVLTILLHFVGGAGNPFFLYYVFHVTIAGILLSVKATYLQATWAVLLFGTLVGLEYSGALPPVAIPRVLGGTSYGSPLSVAALLVAFVSAVYVMAYLVTSIVGRLRAREREIVALNETLRTREEQLRAAYERLVETERFKSEYMRKVGHELRAPLSAAQSLLSTILADLAGTLPDRAKALLQRVYVRNQELLALVGDLLVLARLREPKTEPGRGPTDPGEIAHRAVDLFGGEAESKGVDLEPTIPPDLPAVAANRDEMEQLFSNLISNAIKYTPRGGKVRLQLAPANGWLRIVVADTGIGIAQKDLPRIFDEFFRTEQARELVTEGTGLGLAIVKQIIDSHGGKIEVDSAPGYGTTFTVLLPAAGRGNAPGESKYLSIVA